VKTFSFTVIYEPVVLLNPPDIGKSVTLEPRLSLENCIYLSPIVVAGVLSASIPPSLTVSVEVQLS
jgi:hypothetical protein